MNYCRLEKINVTESEPYKNDLLGRKKSGLILRQLVESFSDGFVLALNGKWGSGKTTFVEMWQKQMEKDGYKAIYYNAWETDHISDPLIGLIAEFKKMTTVPGEKQLKKFSDAFRKISLSMVPSLLALMAKKYTGLDLEDFEKVIKDGAEEAMNILNKSVDNYIEQQKSITEFRKALTEYVRLVSPSKPIIFIIDELDRCKPDFAVKTLERIKHLFTVQNVVFILAIDREQLGNSVRGYYGSDLIDADDYLRRFIDVQYDITIGNASRLVAKVFERFDFSNSILSKGKFAKENYNIGTLQFFIESLFTSNHLSIRQLEKWILHSRLVLNHLSRLHISPETLSFLVYLHDFDTVFYNHLLNEDLDDQKILDNLTNYFSISLFATNYYNANFTFRVIAELLSMKYYGDEASFHQRIIDQKGKLLLTIDDVNDEKLLKDAFGTINDSSILPLSVINSIISDISSIDN